MCMNEAFCVTGSDDGYLRLWPLDFAQVYLEAGTGISKILNCFKNYVQYQLYIKIIKYFQYLLRNVHFI